MRLGSGPKFLVGIKQDPAHSFSGRAVFGIGEGPLEVLMTLICMRWFTENDPIAPTLEFSFGVTSAAGISNALPCVYRLKECWGQLPG